MSTSDELEKVLIDILADCAQKKGAPQREDFIRNTAEVLGKYKLAVREETIDQICA